MKINQGEKQKAFSVVELLVISFIIATLSVLVLVNYRTGQRQYALNKVVMQLASDIRRAQNLALSGTLTPTGCTPGSDCSTGYGIHVNSASQYIIFYNRPGMPVGWQYQYRSLPPVPSVIKETVQLPSDIAMNTGDDIFFVPPDPTTYIDGDPSGSETFSICPTSCSACDSSCSQWRQITVDSSGRIDIQ